MQVYWIKAQAPLRDDPNILSWLGGLMQLPAWADPWPA